MGRFDEVTQKLKDAQTNITNSLNAKGCGGGSLEKVKISEVSGYIDSIEVGSDNDPRIINITTDVNSDFATADVQAVQGDITIKGQLQNSKGTLEVPKDGKWTVSAPNVVGAVSAEVDFPVQTKDVLLTSKCTASIKITMVNNNHTYDEDGRYVCAREGVYTYNVIFNNDYSNQEAISFANSSVIQPGDRAVIANYNCSKKGFGTYLFNIPYLNTASGKKYSLVEYDTTVRVTSNKVYEVTLYATGFKNDPPTIDPPEIFDDYPLSQPTEPTIEYLESLGKTEEEAEQTLTAWKNERSRYVELEQTGMESDEILTTMYPSIDV